MCLIIVKDSKAKMPTEKFLSQVWSKNPDGGGFMYIRDKSNTVIMEKGFMKLKEFIKAIDAKRFTKNDLVCLHLRKTTAGKTNKANCHPVIVSRDKKASTLIKCKSEKRLFMMHNGTISEMDDHLSSISDTVHFARKIMADINRESLYESETMKTLIEKYVDESRLCFLSGIRGLLLLGKWYAHEGLKLSKAASIFTQPKTSFFSATHGSTGYTGNYGNYFQKSKQATLWEEKPTDIVQVSNMSEYQKQFEYCNYCSAQELKKHMGREKSSMYWICKTCIDRYNLHDLMDITFSNSDNHNSNICD